MITGTTNEKEFIHKQLKASSSMIGKNRGDGTIDAAALMYKKTLEEAKSKFQAKKIKDLSDAYLNYGRESKQILPDVEFKRTNGWLLKFPKRLNIPEWLVKSVQRPSFPFDGTFIVELYSPVYSNNGKLLKYLTSTQKKGIKIRLELLDPTGAVIEECILKECYIKEAHWSTLNYTDDTPMIITLCLSYEKINFKIK